MRGAIVSPFKPVRSVLRQLLAAIDPEIALLEESHTAGIEAMIQANDPAFIFMSLPSVAEGGLHRASAVKLNFPDITLAVIVSYDIQEYAAVFKTFGIDHLLSEENMDRQIIQRIINNVKPQ